PGAKDTSHCVGNSPSPLLSPPPPTPQVQGKGWGAVPISAAWPQGGVLPPSLSHVSVFQVILERYPKEKVLPALDRTKFLVPQELTMGQFVTIIRNRMALSSTQSFYLLVDGSRSLVSMSLTMTEVYTLNRDEDGFLYMTYASQEMFG
uniref:Microtubule-associated protein 1 light chain 3 gamma n=1 Tax=Chrysemys picta bellii TaxID=8478 RepID=A0A8C3P960_CHRPI